MCRQRMIRTLTLLVAATSFLALRAAPQDQPSVAEAARRARQQKQPSAKPPSVITNETLTPAPGTSATASASSTTPSGDTATAANQAGPDAGSSEKKPAAASNDDAEQEKQDTAKLKEQIAEKQAQVKLLESDFALQQDTFYRNPDYQRDAAGKNKLDSIQSDIKQAQDELAALRAKLRDLGAQDDSKPSKP